jgi:hypothetical protein
MKKELEIIIELIKPAYDTDQRYRYPLPNEITLYLDSELHLIDLNLKEGVLNAEVWIGEDEVNLTDKDVEFIYNYLDGLLAEQIDLTKRYYEEERYEDETSYYIR